MIRRLDFIFGIARTWQTKLHVGLTPAEPDVAHKDVSKDDSLGSDNFDGVGPTWSGRLNLHLPAALRSGHRLRGAAGVLGLDAGIDVTKARDVEQALAEAQAATSAVLVIGSMPIVVQRRIRALALERKLPLLTPWRAWEGGSSTLIAYGPHFTAVADRTAAIIDRILKGARPGDLPVEQPTSYELVIDGVMAKALGLTIPPGVRARADDVLE